MVSGEYMQPTFEILNVVDFYFYNQLFENLHYGILALLFILQVIEAYPEYQMHVPVVKNTKHLQIARCFILGDQCSIVKMLQPGCVFNELQVQLISIIFKYKNINWHP